MFIILFKKSIVQDRVLQWVGYSMGNSQKGFVMEKKYIFLYKFSGVGKGKNKQNAGIIRLFFRKKRK